MTFQNLFKVKLSPF